MDTPGLDVESVTGMVGGGAQVVVFTTGLGTPTGNPIAPVIKITGNARTAASMADNIDLDVSGVLDDRKRSTRRRRGCSTRWSRSVRAARPRPSASASASSPFTDAIRLSEDTAFMATPTATRFPAVGARVGRWRWVICALLFFATTINYIDRQVLGILAPDLQKEIGWSGSTTAGS